MSTPKTVTIKFDAHTNPYIPQSESTVDSLKIFNSSEWINDRFTLPTKAKCRKNPANSPRVNQFRFIQKSWLEKMNQFWFTLQLELVLQNEEKSLVYGLSCAGLIKEQAQTAWLFSGEVRLNSFCQQKMLYKSSHCCKASAFFALYSRFYS